MKKHLYSIYFALLFVLILVNAFIFQKPNPFSWSDYQIAIEIFAIAPLLVLGLIAYFFSKRAKIGKAFFNKSYPNFAAYLGIFSGVIILIMSYMVYTGWGIPAFAVGSLGFLGLLISVFLVILDFFAHN